MFSGYAVLSDSQEAELGSSDREASPSAGKNTGIVLVPCLAWKCVPTAISGGMDISEVPKGSKQDNFEPHNSLKLSFTNI